MPQSSSLPADLRQLYAANVQRLMAQHNMKQREVVAATGLDQRTVRSILRGESQPHMRTLHKLAEGLDVDVDELFQDPYQSGNGEFTSAEFDRATNPIAAEVVDSHPGLFEDWTATDFEELFSRMAVGGELTTAGTLAAARSMNERRQLLQQVAVVLESSEADLMRDFVQLLYRRATSID